MSSEIPLGLYGVLNGLVNGLILFLLSSGLTVVFGLLGVLNVAHASFYMLAAYIAFAIVVKTGNFWLALVVVPVVLGLIGWVVERYLLRKTLKLGHGHQLLLTLGVAVVILNGVQAVWGSGEYRVAAPHELAGTINLGLLHYPIYRIGVCAAALAVLGVLWAVLRKTSIGMRVRAVVSDAPMVGALGHNATRLVSLVFVLGSSLAGLAGVIVAPIATVQPAMAAQVLVELFIVVVIGGLGSLSGAFVASLLLGLLQSMSALFAGSLSSYVGYMALAVVMFWRPFGLFGDAET